MKRSIKIALLCACAVSSLVTGCKNNEIPPTPPVIIDDDGIYEITISTVEHGRAVATLDGEEITEAVAGTHVVITAIPDGDYRFNYWSMNAEGASVLSATSQMTVFVMPTADVVVTPSFVEAGFVSDGGDLGTVTFISTERWVVGNQIWSDAIVATRCKKDQFDGGAESSYKVDCRASEGFGDLFSWEAVNLHSAELCPLGWRIPTREDFFDLDVALGGNGSGGTGDAMAYYDVWGRYLSDWGAQPAGYARTENPDLVFPGAVACYWTQTEVDHDAAFYLYVYSGRVYPQYNESKALGMSVRCVTETLRP